MLPRGKGGTQTGVMKRKSHITLWGSRSAAALFVLAASAVPALAEVCDKTFAEGHGQFIEGTWFHWQLWLQSYRSIMLFATVVVLVLSFFAMRLRLRLLLVGFCSFMVAWCVKLNGLAPVLYVQSIDWYPINEGCVSLFLLVVEPLTYAAISAFALITCWRSVRVSSGW